MKLSPSEWLALASTIAVVVLTGITGWYAWSTAKMLRQLREQTEATRKQADAAERTLQHLLQVAEEQRGVARTVVQTTIETALSNIAHWQNKNLVNLVATHSLPVHVQLVPVSGQRAIEHARTVAPDAALPLSDALTLLQQCESEFQILAQAGWRSMAGAEKQNERIQGLFNDANEQLSLAQEACQ